MTLPAWGRDALVRLRNLVARGTLKGTDDGGKMQRVDLGLMADESKRGVEHFQPYGLTAHARPGAEAVVVFPAGGREHGLVVVIDDRRYRLQGLAEGEVALYSDEDGQGGHRVHLRRGRVVEVRCARLEIKADTVEIDAAETRVTGALTEMTGQGNATAVHEMRERFNAHRHPENGGGGPTDTPDRTM